MQRDASQCITAYGVGHETKDPGDRWYRPRGMATNYQRS